MHIGGSEAANPSLRRRVQYGVTFSGAVGDQQWGEEQDEEWERGQTSPWATSSGVRAARLPPALPLKLPLPPLLPPLSFFPTADQYFGVFDWTTPRSYVQLTTLYGDPDLFVYVARRNSSTQRNLTYVPVTPANAIWGSWNATGNELVVIDKGDPKFQVGRRGGEETFGEGRGGPACYYIYNKENTE